MTPKELAASWRADAETFARYASPLSDVCRRHADELDAALRSLQDEALSLAEAASESGYSSDRLRHLVAAGALPNAGEKGRPRVRRGDLPTKRRANAGGFDAGAVARAVLRGTPSHTNHRTTCKEIAP